MELNEFRRLVKAHQKWLIRVDEIGDTLGSVNIFELDWVSYASDLFEVILKQNFKSKENVDYIMDKVTNVDLGDLQICKILTDGEIEELYNDVC